MVKHIVNESVHGYEKVEINSLISAENTNDLFVIIVDKSCDNDVASYYKAVNNLLRKFNRVMLIGAMDDNKVFKSLASLMITFNAYDLYEIVSKDEINSDYLTKLENRKPSYTEVQTYIGGDAVAYSDMSMILFGIESLVEEGNLDGLKLFIEENMLGIENITQSINKMKKTCDIFNSNELIDEITKAKETEEKLNKDIDSKNKKLEEVKHSRDEFKVEAETLKRENSKLKESVKDADSSGGGNVLKLFKTIQVQTTPGVKAKIILYFKEVSYVRYMNTLVSNICSFLSKKKVSYKCLIYDTNTDMCNIYSPLRVVNGTSYVTDKTHLLNKADKFVVTEPAQNILTDVITSANAFDVVIIYDRMHTVNDLITGNLVSKFFVFNSHNDYDKLKATLKITDTSHVITYAKNTINKDSKDFLDIPEIADFTANNVGSDQYALGKYMRQCSTYSKPKPDGKVASLIEEIMARSRINSLYGN